MKFSRCREYHGGEVQMGEQCGIGMMLIERFRKDIPNPDKTRFDSVLEIDPRNNTYEVKLEQFGVSRRRIENYMKDLGCSPL